MFRFTTVGRLAMGLAILGLASAGCGGGGGGGGSSFVSTTPLTLHLAPASVAANGSDVATITLTVRDSNGNPIPGEQITLQCSGSGNILVQPGLTNAAGVSTGTLASTVPETKTITAIGPLTSQTATGTEVFTPATSTGPTTLTAVSGNLQQGPAGTTLLEPLVVQVLDANGRGVAEVIVTFAATTGGGTLSTTQTATDLDGFAVTTLTLGPTAGNNSVVAAARDFSGTNLQGSPITFNETATPRVTATLR